MTQILPAQVANAIDKTVNKTPYIPGAPTEAQNAISANLASQGTSQEAQQAAAAGTSYLSIPQTEAPAKPTTSVGGMPTAAVAANLDPTLGAAAGSSVNPTVQIPSAANMVSGALATPVAPTAPSPIPDRTRASIKGLPTNAASMSGGNVYDANGVLIGTVQNNRTSRGTVATFSGIAQTREGNLGVAMEAAGAPTATLEAKASGGMAPGSSISPQDGTTVAGTTPQEGYEKLVAESAGGATEAPKAEEPAKETTAAPAPPTAEDIYSLMFGDFKKLQDEAKAEGLASKESVSAMTDQLMAQFKVDRNTARKMANDAMEDQETARGLAALYDQGLQQSIGANAADFARMSDEYARGAANPEAQDVARRAVQQAVQAARASGINRGQAALVGGQQGGTLFSQAYQDAIKRATERYAKGAEFFQTAGKDQAARQDAAAGRRDSATGLALDATKAAGSTGLLGEQLKGNYAQLLANLGAQSANVATGQLNDLRSQQQIAAGAQANTLGAIGNVVQEALPFIMSLFGV